jgi:hypothetical protein
MVDTQPETIITSRVSNVRDLPFDCDVNIDAVELARVILSIRRR